MKSKQYLYKHYRNLLNPLCCKDLPWLSLCVYYDLYVVDKSYGIIFIASLQNR